MADARLTITVKAADLPEVTALVKQLAAERDQAQAAIARVRAVVEDMDGITGARTWASWLHAALDGAAPGCGCDGDPIECQHEAALGMAEALLARVREYAATSDDDGIRTRETVLGIVGELPGSALGGSSDDQPPKVRIEIQPDPPHVADAIREVRRNGGLLRRYRPADPKGHRHA